MIRVLFVLQQAFSLWMLVDAIRRGSRPYWYLVVLMPFGEWVYFFVVKIHDPEFEPIRAFFKRLTERKVTIEDLRYQLEQTPSYATNLALAQGLFDQQSYGDARRYFTEALRLHDGDREATYGLARTDAALNDYEAALEGYRRLIDLDPAFRDYAVYSDLAHVLVDQDRSEEAFELLDQLVTKSPRLGHRVLYAHYLRAGGRQDQARQVLENGLIEYRQAPKFIRRRDRMWVGRAKKMLKDS